MCLLNFGLRLRIGLATHIGTYNSPYSHNNISLAIQDDEVFFGDVEIISVANLASPALVSEYVMAEGTGEIKLRAEFAYMVDRRGIQIVDVTDPENPERRGRITLPEKWSRVVDVQEDYVYLIDRHLEIINIADPDNPVQVGTAEFSGSDIPRRVDVDGEFAYVEVSGPGNGSLHVFNIGNPAVPELVGALEFQGEIRGLAVEGSLAYLTVAKDLVVVDVTDPAEPVVAGSVNLNGQIYSLAIRGSLAFVISDNSEVKIVDVSNPASPALLSACKTASRMYDLCVQGSYLVVACPPLIQVINISNPHSPYVDGHYDIDAYGVAMSGDFVYTAGRAGLEILRMD